MSLVSVKKQLSADLERFSSRKKTFKNPRNSNQILSVRHLGDVTSDAPILRFHGNMSSSSLGQSRPFSESIEHRYGFLRNSERPRTIATIPVTPPSSRQNIRVTASQQFLRNTGRNTNNEVTKLSLSGNFSEFNNPSNGRFWSGVTLPGRQSVSGFEILTGDLPSEDLPTRPSCYASNKLLGRGLGSSFQVAVQRKRPSVRIVVNVPRIDVGETTIVFPYKHGNIRILDPRYTGRKALER